MSAWLPADLTAAVAAIAEEGRRCQGCGFDENDAWHVAADTWQCPTCQDRDMAITERTDPKTGRPPGLRPFWVPMETTEERVRYSAASRLTRHGRELAAMWRRQEGLSDG